MELRGYLHALRVRWLLVVALTVLGGLVGVVVTLLTPTVHAAAVSFYVSTPPAEPANAASATQYAQSKVNSYVALLRSDEVARRVIADQRLDEAPAAVAASISAGAQLNTLVVTATVQDTSADRALAIASGLADTFGPLVDELDNTGRSGDVVRLDVVSGPTLAAAPVSPRPVRLIGLGLVLGLLVGALLAVLRDLLDVTVRSAAVATEVTGLPTLAVVDDDPDPAVRAEAVRQLRTNLAVLRAADRPGGSTAGLGQVLVVASALAGEGRTTTTLDLARSVVETGSSVVVLEADLRRPALAAALGLPAGPGLADVLTGGVEAGAALRTLDDGTLVLPGGTAPPNPAELLGSPRMAALVGSLAAAYDLVLLDTPPLLHLTDAAVCATLADGALLVLRRGRTPRTDVTEASRMLRQVRAETLGTILVGGRS